MNCPRLIEVALPIREISAESVRDKSLRHGHISTLHLWWARRPLAACRAVVFASLVPDPDDPNCPSEFRDSVISLLKDNVPQSLKGYWRGRNFMRDNDPYKPYDDIQDTPRNLLLTFIAKWSPEWIAFEKGENDNQPSSNQMLDDRSLVKWETSDPGNEQGREVLRIARKLILIANNGSAPTLLDPFAGGGAIPLEATRLGCQATANDYNPVAYLILRATCEFPQKYGKLDDEGSNQLARDVEYWAKWILKRAKDRIGHLYPAGRDGRPVVGYLWARTAPCSNPACRSEIPLLRSRFVCRKQDKRIALTMDIEDKRIIFGIARNNDIKKTDGTMLNRGDCRCPICGQITPVIDLRRAGLEGKMGERVIAVITNTANGKDYRPVELVDLKALEEVERISEQLERPSEAILPEITNSDSEDISNSTGIRVHLYGFKNWGSLFNTRQLLAMQTFVTCLQDALKELSERETKLDYREALGTFLGLWESKLTDYLASFGTWTPSGEFFGHMFTKQAIAMVWDYPEVNPFNKSTGGALSHIGWILRVISHESPHPTTSLTPAEIYCNDGAQLPHSNNTADVVVTDPPYFNSIAYADLSDIFYIWLKRGLGATFPKVFATPLTPKTNEAIALRHRHDGDADRADRHFTTKLAACLAEAKRVCEDNGIVTVMFAHQSTKAWSALIMLFS